MIPVYASKVSFCCIVSDATAYYTAKGTFSAGANGSTSTIKWNEVTNVPMKNPEEVITKDGVLVIGGQDCIKFTLRDKAANKPAHFVIAKQNGTTGVCAQVQNAEPLKAYFSSKVTNVTINNGGGAIAIGSSTSIYDE
ncbi:hypothetical protein [Campylobacter sp.]|uniref:hypothetical protein n=1 Tax=Campylobacter sp. TaxID=205 RepID=UPI002AA689C9|nr:hypothetical protein [Campylobacter sp.]MCI6564096.1 hypothetical protein [Campylobacter sp.]